MLELKQALLRHRDFTVLIDDFVEKLDLAWPLGERVAAHMQPIARSYRPPPLNLFDSGLFDDRRARGTRRNSSALAARMCASPKR